MSDGRQTGNGRYVHDSQHESKLKSDLARIDNTARDVMGPNEWGDGSYHDARAFRSVVRLRGAILKLLNLVFNRRPCLLLLALRRSRQGSWHSRAERWRSGVHLVCHEYQRSEMAASAIMRELLSQTNRRTSSANAPPSSSCKPQSTSLLSPARTIRCTPRPSRLHSAEPSLETREYRRA